MKKSYQKLIIFDIIFVIILLLNSFILNILGNYFYMDIFLIILLIIFKLLFGFEKDRHRYVKDIITNMLIILLVSFIMYYILGIFIGFYRTTNYLSFYGIRTFIIPYMFIIVAREYLRMQMLYKTEKSKIFTIVTCFVFILLDLSSRIGRASFDSSYNVFIFIALTILPIMSSNIACTYIARKVGYKPNIFWLIIFNMYTVFIPIAPNGGLYIQSLIQFLFPFVLMYNVYMFFQKREKNIPISYIKKRVYVEIYTLAILVFVLAYFVSGYFRYYAVAVATGSMVPKINVGDIAIVDQKVDYKTYKVGEVIAYKYHGIVVVHRLYDIVTIKGDYYFYTKGDANDTQDNYIIYPDMILGRVSFKIPYAGIPTVWLNKIFKKI